MRRFMARVSVKTQYMVLYLVIMLLPVFCMLMLFYDNQIKIIQEDVEALHTYRITQIRNAFDAKFRDLHAIAVGVAHDTRLLPYVLAERESARIESMAILKALNAHNTLSNQLYLYYPSLKRIYSGEGITSVESWTVYAYTFTEEQKTRFLEIIERPSDITWETMRLGNLDILLAAYPLRLTTSAVYGAAFFLIDLRDFMQQFTDALGGIEGCSLIVDGQGRVIAQSDSGSWAEEARAAVDGMREGIHEIEVGQAKYVVISAASNVNGLRYAIVTPAETFLARLMRQRSFYMQTAILVLLVGIALAVALSRLNYRPIQNIVRDIGENAQVGNELASIHSSVITYKNRNVRLKQQLEQQTAFITDSIIERLLAGRIDPQEARETIAMHGILFEHAFFQVIVVDCQRGETEAEQSALRQQVLRVAMDMELEYVPALSLTSIERGYENTILLLLNMDEEDEVFYPAALHQKLGRMAERLSIGAGRAYGSLEELTRSFSEAVACVESVRFYKGNGLECAVEWAENTASGEEEQLLDLQRRFLQSLRQGNHTIARLSVAALYARLTADDKSLLWSRCMLLDTINQTVKLAGKIAEDRFQEEISRLVSIRSFRQSQNDMIALSDAVCEYVAEQRESSAQRLSEQLLQYVRENFSDPYISLDAIAEHFGLSNYYVSRIFSQQIKTTFKDYLSMLRIDMAKALLRETSLPLKEIVIKIGYLDASSFIKKFKAVTEVTPGDFRKIAIDAIERKA